MRKLAPIDASNRSSLGYWLSAIGYSLIFPAVNARRSRFALTAGKISGS
jgi:hypothetical protein